MINTNNKLDGNENPFENILILPPKPGVCQICAVAHDPKMPHNRDSLYYQVRFHHQHRRFPTWWDAMSHCDDHVKKIWMDTLAEYGVIVIPPDEKADGQPE